MREELIKLLDNCYSEIDKFKCSCIVVMNDGKKFNGVNIKNSIYRDSIYGEVSAITGAVSSGYKKGNFDSIYILTNNSNYYICKEIIKEFFEDDKSVHIYTLDDNSEKTIKVGDL